MQDYTKLGVWQKSYTFCLDVYHVTRSFPKEELYGMVSQIRRAAVSIPANIAEGCGRHTDNDLLRFLDIALGSVAELDTLLRLAHDLDYFAAEDDRPLESRLLEIKKMLTALILKIRNEVSHRE